MFKCIVIFHKLYFASRTKALGNKTHNIDKRRVSGVGIHVQNSKY